MIEFDAVYSPIRILVAEVRIRVMTDAALTEHDCLLHGADIAVESLSMTPK